MSSQPNPTISPSTYLALERASDFKSEYLNGLMVAMSGASREHNLIVTNLVAGFGHSLKGKPDEVYPGQMRVRVSDANLYTYPDVVVVCGEPQFEDREFDTLLNPAVLVEVLSDLTESYDRGKKFGFYRTLPSFTDYLLVAQDECHIEHYARQSDGRWLLTVLETLDAEVTLPSIACRLPLAEIYDRVFPPAESAVS